MYSMKEACEMFNMNYQTLKFYCNEGLIPNVKRDENNYRIFDEKDIEWLRVIMCLKNCGMSIKEMKEYVNLCLNGNSTIPQRKQLLCEKKKNLEALQQQIQDSINFIDKKQKYYDEILSGNKVDTSDLSKPINKAK
ncbi:MAG: MerR family transcriptional regulator [Bacilli bacterium]